MWLSLLTSTQHRSDVTTVNLFNGYSPCLVRIWNQFLLKSFVDESSCDAVFYSILNFQYIVTF